MPTYNLVAKREIFYELEIEADTEAEAIKEMERREISDNIEDYAYEWFPLEIVEIEEAE